MKNPKTKKKPSRKLFRPDFQPQYVEVLLDEGVREMRGNLVRLAIKDIRYGAGEMQIIVVK